MATRQRRHISVKYLGHTSIVTCREHQVDTAARVHSRAADSDIDAYRMCTALRRDRLPVSRRPK